jgi:hypothetical protein
VENEYLITSIPLCLELAAPALISHENMAEWCSPATETNGIEVS